MKFKLVKNWKKAWRWFSVHCMALAGSVQATWLLIPDDMKRSLPTNYVMAATVLLLVAGIVGRLVDQGSSDA